MEDRGLRMLSALVLFLCVFFWRNACAAEMDLAAQLRFANAVSYASNGNVTVGIAVGDLNGDGYPDIVLANQGSSSVSVLLGKGDGTFQNAVTYGSGGPSAHSVAIGDLNGDGIPDLAVATFCAADGCTNGGVSVLLGNGDGTFRGATSYHSGGVQAFSVAIGDLNHDGKPDLVVANFNSSTGSVGVLLGNGDGTFRTAVSYASGGQAATSVAVGDLNGDGVLDLVVANLCGLANCIYGELGVLLGNGDGTFKTTVGYSSGGSNAESVTIVDLNGDGFPDLAAANYSLDGGSSGGVGVLLGRGDGTFQPAAAYPSGGKAATSVAVGDLNGDGVLDLVVANLCGLASCIGELGVLLGNGDGTFQRPVGYASGGVYAESVAIKDVNKDARPDLVAASECDELPGCNIGRAGVLLNTFALRTTTTVASAPNPSHVSQTVTITATITSATPIPNGDVVTFYRGTTKIGTAPTTNGVARLSTSFSKAGNFYLKAKYPGDVWHKPSYGTVIQVVNP